MTMPLGLHAGIDDARYHADDAVSRSRLLDLARSPAHCLYYRSNPKDDTDALRFGRLLHMAILVPREFTSAYCAGPDIDRRTGDGKRAWELAENAAHAQKRSLVRASEWEAIEGITAAVKRSRAASQILYGSQGQSEMTCVWLDQELGLRCKARIDRVITGTAHGTLLLDLKSCQDSSPREVAKEIVFRKHHVQGAWYMAGYQAVTGGGAGAFAFLSYEKKPPYTCSLCVLTPTALATGARESRELLRLYAQCIKSGIWPDHSDQVYTVDLPGWYVPWSNATTIAMEVLQ